MNRLMRIFIVALFIVSMGRAEYIDELKSYLLGRSFPITGEFFNYQNRWVLGVFDSQGRIGGYYQLMGEDVNISNPFGWKALGLELEEEKAVAAGYFIKIDFPYDMQNSYLKPYSWLYVDIKTKNIYKLIGSNNGIFKYYDADFDGVPDPLKGIYFNKEGNKAQFYSCKDSLEYKNYRLTKYSKYSGDVRYDCSFDKNGFFIEGKKDIENIIETITLSGTLNKKEIKAQIYKDFKKGTVSVEGFYNGRYVVCYNLYKPFVDQNITAAKLNDLLAHWGEGGSKNEDFVSGNCPNMDNQEKLENADLVIKKDIQIIEKNSIAKISIWESMKKE